MIWGIFSPKLNHQYGPCKPKDSRIYGKSVMFHLLQFNTKRKKKNNNNNMSRFSPISSELRQDKALVKWLNQLWDFTSNAYADWATHSSYFTALHIHECNNGSAITTRWNSIQQNTTDLCFRHLFYWVVSRALHAVHTDVLFVAFYATGTVGTHWRMGILVPLMGRTMVVVTWHSSPFWQPHLCLF